MTLKLVPFVGHDVHYVDYVDKQKTQDWDINAMSCQMVLSFEKQKLIARLCGQNVFECHLFGAAICISKS